MEPFQLHSAARWRRLPGRLGRCLVGLAALLLVAQIVMGITGIPSAVVRWFTSEELPPGVAPRVIVVLGGGGIPSESGLMRTYCAAVVGRRYPASRLICSLPADGDPETSSVGRMRDELVLRGIPRESVSLESKAHNTHEQAVAIRNLLGPAALNDPLILVTSPSHTRRAVLCFRRQGFTQVGGVPALEVDTDADLGNGLFVRYGFWNALESQVRFLREFAAMVYYKLRGWI